MKNKKKVFSRFFDSQLNTFTLSQLAQYTAVFYFNMRTVHFLTEGENFLEIHEYAQELYEQAEDYYDDLIETALSYKEQIQPMYVVPGDWSPETANYNMTVGDSIRLMKDSVQKLFDYMEKVNRDIYSSFVYSKVDSILEYFDKQNYKLNQMGR